MHTCLFEFTSQDCVDFEFDTEGWMKNDANIRVVLFDTDGNEYSSGIKRVMLKAKGEILHKVKIKYKNEVVGVTKRRFF